MSLRLATNLVFGASLALLTAGPAAAEEAAPAAAEEAAAEEAPPAEEEAPAPEAAKPAGHPGGGGIELPWNLRLNGRFDVAYERTDFKGDPTDGKDAIKNYHHFLFLTRDSAKDPFFLRAELIDLSFYEFGMRFSGGEGSKWKGNFRAGKLMVPFGPEPLFHRQYGGRSGFDNEVFPAFFSQLGVAGNFQTLVGPLRISTDLYAVQGYRVGSETAVLDLKSNFSRSDDPEIAVGARVGLGFGPISAWYSAMINEVGFGRTLWMQALDVSIWRWPDVPVLEDLVLGFGATRADVSGGGSGIDHYHFADYLYLRYYPTDYLYLQYRAGLRTYNNRRDEFIDETRLDASDNSTHNFGVVYSRQGYSLGLFYYLNMEKADEVDNDLLRLLLTYEF